MKKNCSRINESKLILLFFFMFGPYWTQVCSHITGYIPVHIGLLFAIAPTHDWNGNGATQTFIYLISANKAEHSFTDGNEMVRINELL